MNEINIFEEVKRISFSDVLQSFHSEITPRVNKIFCPFHDERTRSFHVYSDSFYCFGCGKSGDSVTFVAELLRIRPIEAARMIAQKFGLSVGQALDDAEKIERTSEATRKRKLAGEYQKLEAAAFLNLANFRSQALEVMKICGIEISQGMVNVMHTLPLVDEWLRILAMGSLEERLGLFREGVLSKWAIMNS